MRRRRFKTIKSGSAVSKRIDKWLAEIGRSESRSGSRKTRKKHVIWAGIKNMSVRAIARRNINRRSKRPQWWRNEGIKMNDVNGEIFLGANDIADLITSKILHERSDRQLETFQTRLSMYATKKEWLDYIDTIQDIRRFQYENGTGYFFDDDSFSYLFFNIHSTHVSVELVGDEDFVEKYEKQFETDFEFVTNQIEWIYSSDGSSIEIPLRHDRMPVEEMYPFLEGQTLAEFYDGFMHSSASILLLIGPPGTGKTTFIRGLLQHSEASAIVSYDSNVLEKDYVFANFIEGEKNVLVLEDADMFLKARSEGNTMMHKFLNVGDGLVTTRNKKLIFSTNLPSIRDIDSALIRPGRCYDILHFDELNQEQAEKLATKVGTKLNRERSSWSIADVFFEQNTNMKKTTERKMGFI
jgi:adenylate kinase family enzyme